VVVGSLRGVSAADDPASTEGVSGRNPEFSADANVISDELDDFWSKTFEDQNRTYESPKVKPFADALQSPCKAPARNRISFYCVSDRTIYLNKGFQDALASSSGNFAQAYVIAHLYGHHVQEVLGIWDRVVEQELNEPPRIAELSRNVELQADCLAGYGVGGIAGRDAPTPQLFTTAVELVASVAQPRVKPLAGVLNAETWQNGPVDEQEDWFGRGLALTDVAACDTFTG
jgi:predicted metalloprotease